MDEGRAVKKVDRGGGRGRVSMFNCSTLWTVKLHLPFIFFISFFFFAFFAFFFFFFSQFQFQFQFHFQFHFFAFAFFLLLSFPLAYFWDFHIFLSFPVG